MDLAFKADRARSQGAEKEAGTFYEEALELELQAIRELKEPVEPTHSVLHRSAAWLALDCGDVRQAEKLAATALAKEPPHEIAEELRNVWEQALYYRHLGLHGVFLADNEIQMSLSGPGVGKGVTEWKTYRKRVDQSHRMLTRIAERRAERPFRPTGPPTKDIQDLLKLHVSLPRAASYAVTLKLGQGSQIPLKGVLNFPDIPEVIDEFLGIVELVDDGNIDQLVRLIPDDQYCRSAVAIAKQLAPDGHQIRQVGFTASRDGEVRAVSFTRTRREVSDPVARVDQIDPDRMEVSAVAIPVKVKGVLLFANAIDSGNRRIRIVDQEGASHEFTVPPEMMDDVVRPMWNSMVTACGVQRGNEVILHDIDSD